MLTCMYQPPVTLGKTCLLKVNRDTKKVIVRQFSAKPGGGQVRVELVQSYKFLSPKRKTVTNIDKPRRISTHSQSDREPLLSNDEDEDDDDEEGTTDPESDEGSSLSETCGLSISELEEMAARQARQLETQEQLLAAKAQRLRYLKSGGEAERLMRLREKVATQEERLRKLRALRGKVQSNKHGNTLLSSDLESLRAVFNEKEKELSVAVAKVDELTRQLEDLRRGGSKDTNGIGNGMLSNHAARNSQSTASVELDKLRRELLYRQKLREAQATKVADQRTKLTHRQEESNRVDRRIAELQERLHRKRFLNHQLAVTLKHQENVEDFLEKGVPTKNDSKYQTLPYNAKFTPFSVKHHQNYEDAQHEHVQDQAKFDKAIQQMQIITLDHHLEQPTRNSQLPVGNHKFNFGTNYHLHHQILHHNHQNTKSANCVIDAVAEPQLSNGTGHVPKSISAITGIREEDTSGCPRPYNYIPTGAIHSPDGNGIFSQSGTTRDVTSCSGSNGSISGSSSDGLGPTDSKNPRPALPPKPSKPTLPMRNTQSEVFPYGQRRILSTGDGNMMIPDRTELPIKAMPLFVKKSTTTSSSGNEASPTTSVPPLLSSTTTIHKITSSSTGNTGPLNGKTNNAMVRMSINRRIEMPPAFLFPESDPPPSDLVPEQYSSSTTSSLSSSASITSLPTTNLESRNNGENNDTVDATPLPSHSNQKGISPGIEEYTLPDLFPLSSPSSTENVFTKRIITLHSNRLSPNNNSTHQFPSTTLSSHHSILHDNNYSNNNTNYSNNNNYHDSSPTDSTNENNYENGQDNQQEAAIKSLSFPAVSDQEFSLKSKQLESPDTVIQDESQGRAEQNFIYDKENHENGNIGACESGNENNGNLETNNEFQHIPSIIKRIKKGNLKSSNKESSPSGRRVSFDPLALLLDASLEGELELVMKTAREVGNPSAANDEGITALHNSICAGHADVVRFLVEFGCDVNAQDSDGWTPLHCAASCNNVGMVKFLVEHGACIFATTLSDHETAAEKCEEDEDGFGPCTEYLYSIQEKLGITNNGVVYAVFDYEAQNPDELSFEAGKRLTVLRKGDEVEREWWWSISENETQGYIPRNLLGLYPRVMPEKRNAEC